MEKTGNLNIFDFKPIRKDFGFKFASAEVYNDILYVGDQNGNLHSYALTPGSQEIIPDNANKISKVISKSKIDKIICYGAINTILILSEEKLLAIDIGLKRPVEQLATKIHDFAINENFIMDEGLHSVVAISRKRQGYLFYYNTNTKKLEDIKAKFSVADLPTCLGYTNNYIVLAYKKDYQVLNVDKSFAMKKGPLSSKIPYFKITNSNEVLYFSEDIGIFMEPQFIPKQKDNIFVPKPVLSIRTCGMYFLIMFEGLIQIYSTFDPKKITLVQQVQATTAKGITSSRPFIYSRDSLYYLYEIPYQIQIKSLLDKCRVEQAIGLLIQNVGTENEQKIEELKVNAVWPLLKKMQFEKVKDLIVGINFDIRQIILLFPEILTTEIDTIKARAEKTMATMILQYINEKGQKAGQNQENQLKKKSKIFLREILQIKRQQYIGQAPDKRKIKFYTSKNSLIKQKLELATPEEILETIDFSLIKWFLQMKMLRNLEQFFLASPVIYCKRLYKEFQILFRKNQKIADFPTLIPRFYTAFEKIDEAFDAWKRISQSTKDSTVKIACEQAVKLLASFENKDQIIQKLGWILQKRPQIAMSFFNMVPINFVEPEQIIKSFEHKNQKKYLQLYLQIIVNEKQTEVQEYHTKLLLIYLDNLFDINPKANKQEGKTVEFAEKIGKMRKFLKSPNAKYVSQPILRHIDKCQWLLKEQIFLYAREKRHEDALRKYLVNKMQREAEKYCLQYGDQTLTILFKMLLTMYRSYESSKNEYALLVKKDILTFLKMYSSNSELDPLAVLENIPEDWMLNDGDSGSGGVYQFLQSAITHTLHEKRSNYAARHLSEMDLLNAEYNLIQAKKAYLKFTYTKKCSICDVPIADKFFVVYPNAVVCHQACVKNQKNTICPITKQDFEKTFKY